MEGRGSRRHPRARAARRGALVLACIAVTLWALEGLAAACLSNINCSGVTPVCGTSLTCRACESDLECGAPLSGDYCATSGSRRERACRAGPSPTRRPRRARPTRTAASASCATRVLGGPRRASSAVTGCRAAATRVPSASGATSRARRSAFASHLRLTRGRRPALARPTPTAFRGWSAPHRTADRLASSDATRTARPPLVRPAPSAAPPTAAWASAYGQIGTDAGPAPEGMLEGHRLRRRPRSAAAAMRAASSASWAATPTAGSTRARSRPTAASSGAASARASGTAASARERRRGAAAWTRTASMVSSATTPSTAAPRASSAATRRAAGATRARSARIAATSAVGSASASRTGRPRRAPATPRHRTAAVLPATPGAQARRAARARMVEARRSTAAMVGRPPSPIRARAGRVWTAPEGTGARLGTRPSNQMRPADPSSGASESGAPPPTRRSPATARRPRWPTPPAWATPATRPEMAAAAADGGSPEGTLEGAGCFVQRGAGRRIDGAGLVARRPRDGRWAGAGRRVARDAGATAARSPDGRPDEEARPPRGVARRDDISTGAPAQQAAGFALDSFDPAERGSDWFASESLDLRGYMRPAAGVVADWGHEPLVLANPDGSFRYRLVSDQVVVHPGASLVLLDRMRFSFDMPVVVYAGGDSFTLGGQALTAPSSFSAGDLRMGFDLRLYGKCGDPFTIAFGAQAYLPTGSRASFTSDSTLRLQPQLLAGGQGGRSCTPRRSRSSITAEAGDYGPSQLRELVRLQRRRRRHGGARRTSPSARRSFGSTVVTGSDGAFPATSAARRGPPRWPLPRRPGARRAGRRRRPHPRIWISFGPGHRVARVGAPVHEA